MEPKHHTEDRFDVAIWNHEGDVVKAFWDVDEDEVESIRERYEDDPMVVVVMISHG